MDKAMALRVGLRGGLERLDWDRSWRVKPEPTAKIMLRDQLPGADPPPLDHVRGVEADDDVGQEHQRYHEFQLLGEPVRVCQREAHANWYCDCRIEDEEHHKGVPPSLPAAIG